MAATAKYRNVGNIPREVEKGDKRPMLAPGEFVDLDKDEAGTDHNKSLIEEGWLLAVDTKGGK